jgi:hypothetical protein
LSALKEATVSGFIEPAENDRWAIEVVTPGDEANLAGLGSIVRTGRGAVPPGEPITQLFRKHERGGRTLVMSDTPDEMRDLYPILTHARGRILINGLGLGCAVKALLSIPEVDHIDVVEISPELIELVGPYYDDPRVTIHEGDAVTFEFPAGTRWDAVWHDVWDVLTTDNLNEGNPHAHPCSYEKLHRRYGGRCGWQGSWGWDFLQRQRR